MEQDERMELENAGTAEKKPAKNAVQEGREKTRRNVLHLLAGGYLLYLAWQLGSGFVSGIGENGWNGNMVISLIGAVVFLATGGFLLISCIRRMLAETRGDSDKKD